MFSYIEEVFSLHNDKRSNQQEDKKEKRRFENILRRFFAHGIL